ncbi:MAG TPA: hypothetical protein VD866_22385, partial [Urbifossiella sp.]|nr:hypothetical protein [Urbifossiella sp.]
MVNWNRLNNDLSSALVERGLLAAFLAELGCDLRGSRAGVVFRGPCPVHLGDGDNCEVRADGDRFPIMWACFSHHCQKTCPLKNNLLGFVRGALAGDPVRPARLQEAVAFIEGFLARAGNGPPRPSVPLRRRPSPTVSLTREQV